MIGAHRLQLTGLVAVAQGLTLAAVHLDALLKGGVVEVAERSEHCPQCCTLCGIGVGPVLVAERLGRTGKCTGCSILVQGSVGACGAPAFPCRLKAAVPSRRI